MNEGIYASITLVALRVLKYCSCRISSIIIKLGFIGSESRYPTPHPLWGALSMMQNEAPVDM